MRQHVQTITVAVSDLQLSRSFYSDGLGWTPLLELHEVVYYQVGPGLLLALFSRFDFAADMGAPIGKEAAFSLGQVVDEPEAVDAAIERAREAGARILKEPQDAAFGGYHAYFADPDGHRWEITTGKPFAIGVDGVVTAIDAEELRSVSAGLRAGAGNAGQ